MGGSSSMVTRAAALPGRAAKMTVSAKHYVLFNQMEAPFPEQYKKVPPRMPALPARIRPGCTVRMCISSQRCTVHHAGGFCKRMLLGFGEGRMAASRRVHDSVRIRCRFHPEPNIRRGVQRTDGTH